MGSFIKFLLNKCLTLSTPFSWSQASCKPSFSCKDTKRTLILIALQALLEVLPFRQTKRMIPMKRTTKIRSSALRMCLITYGWNFWRCGQFTLACWFISSLYRNTLEVDLLGIWWTKLPMNAKAIQKLEEVYGLALGWKICSSSIISLSIQGLRNT